MEGPNAPASDAPADRLAEFEAYRSRMNRRILEEKDHLGLKRFFNLDAGAYRPGALDTRTKELLGLVASLVLRCNDCVDYHLLRCIEAGYTDAEIDDALNVGLIIGGSIVIPHLRHAVETVDLVRARDAAAGDGAADAGVRTREERAE